jgi:hypothetical protein
METEPTKSPWQVEVNDVILRHPDHPETTGEWRVIGDAKTAAGMTTIPYEMDDGGEGVFVLEPIQRVTVRPATTYRVHPLLTDTERGQVLTSANDRERTFLLAQVIHRYPEVFDAAHAQLQTARTAGADVLREVTA